MAKKTNKIVTGEFKYRPFYMSQKNYKDLQAIKKKQNAKSFNEVFSVLIKSAKS